MKFVCRIFGFIGLMLVFIFVPFRIFAQEKTPFSLLISPAFHEVTLDKETQYKDVSIKITNPSRQDLSLNIHSLTITQENQTGRIQYLLNQIGKEDNSPKFITILTPTIEVAAGKTATISARINNTENLSPGGHYAAIVAQSTKENQKASDIVPSISSLLFIIKKGGENPALSIESISWKDKVVLFVPKTFLTRFKNTGNVHLIPYGRVEIRDSFGRLTHKGYLNSASSRIFPNNTRDVKVELTKLEWALPFSYNEMKIYGEDRQKYVNYIYSKSFWSIQPIFLLFNGIFIGLIIIFRKKVFNYVKKIIIGLKKSIKVNN